MTNEQLAVLLYELKEDINNILMKCNIEDTEIGAEFAFIEVKIEYYIKILTGRQIPGVLDTDKTTTYNPNQVHDK